MAKIGSAYSANYDQYQFVDEKLDNLIRFTKNIYP